MKKRLSTYLNKGSDVILTNTILDIHQEIVIRAIAKNQNTISTTPEFFLRLIKAARWLKVLSEIEENLGP